MPSIIFTTGNDNYTVSAPGSYELSFLAGDDILTVNGGTLTNAYMGEGADLVRLIAGPATVYGDDGADKFDIWSSNVTVHGGFDNDTINIRGGAGASVFGGTGADRFNIFAATSGVSLHGGDGNDVFYGYNWSVAGTIYGDGGNDYFVKFVSGVTMAGGTGNDIYRVTVGSPATFVENAGEGTDSVQVARGSSYILPANIENISVQGFTGSQSAAAATLTGNASNNAIIGHNNPETIYGMDGNDRIASQGGNDILFGGNGNDVLVGGTGTDTLFGEAGNDTMRGAGVTFMTGGTGDDTYYVENVADTVNEAMGEGIDTVRVFIDDYTLAAHVENGILQNTGFGMTLTGNGLNNVLTGNNGSDMLYGLGGADTVRGGKGDDFIDGGSGSDTMYGGLGDDTFVVRQSGDLVIENVNEGSDFVQSHLTSYILPANVEAGWVEDGVAGASLTGNAMDNFLISADLGSTLNGGDGNDALSGWSDGNDQLFGGDGDDLLYGAGGSDHMDGGFGADTYYFVDVAEIGILTDTVVISEWEDKIDLTEIDADPNTEGDQAFHYTSAGAADGTAGCLWSSPTQMGFYLYGDVDGDSMADFAILISTSLGNIDMWAGTQIVG